MPAVEERVAYVEGQVGEHSSLIVEMRQTMHHFEQRMDARFDGMERRFESMDSRIDRLDHRVSQNFTWVVGIQITTLIAIVGALLART